MAPKVLIAHDFAETFGGAERICAHLGEVAGNAELWTILSRPAVVERMGFGGRHRSVLSPRPRLLQHYRLLAPVYPALVRSRRLPEADLLISSSYAFAHGFRTSNDAPHICYCYSPLRFAWSMTSDYAAKAPGGAAGGLALRALAAFMRAQDRRAAADVTRYVAESHYVAKQLVRNYGIEPDVIWPPVDTKLFRPAPREATRSDYFLFCGRMIEPYKQPTLALEAFRGSEHRLVMVGSGPESSRLEEIAPANVSFVKEPSTAELVEVMQGAEAVVFPSQDDFGLVPVEVMACGRPVLAFAGGGALETVVPGLTGELFAEQSVDSLREAVERFDSSAYDPEAIRRHAERFSVARFRAEMTKVINEVLEERSL